MGRPLTEKRNQRRDSTMRYIAKMNLWSAVALQCQITPSAVRGWNRVPPHRVRDVERAIGRPRRLIRPDLFDDESNHPDNHNS